MDKINLTLSYFGGDYGDEDDYWICLDGLKEYFYLDDNPKEITLVLSKKKGKNSYYVRYDGLLLIELSDGDFAEEAAYFNLANIILRKYPKGCWLSIEA